MSFTDQQPRVATEKDCATAWGFEKNGRTFRCSLCGHRFQPGDTWRWVYADCVNIAKGVGMTNFFTCMSCDGPDVRERMAARWRRGVTEFWFLHGGFSLGLTERVEKQETAPAPSGTTEGR